MTAETDDGGDRFRYHVPAVGGRRAPVNLDEENLDALDGRWGYVAPQRGKAGPGDKTMVDALLPAVSALQHACQQDTPLAQALQESAQAARQGMEGTIPLVARKGRASYLGERSAGHQDPGATSSYLLLKAAAETWSGS